VGAKTRSAAALTERLACWRGAGFCAIPDAFDGSDVRQGSIAGGKYAVFKIEHTAAAMQQAWAQIFAEISKRGWKVDEARPILERYSVKLVQNHECEMCIPIL
jgi:DNA gyrase inhibitor GyrI